MICEAEHAAQFAVEALMPSGSAGTDLLAIHSAYQSWCADKGVEALPASKIGSALAALFDGTGISITEWDGRRIAIGVSVKKRSKRQDMKKSASARVAARPRAALPITRARTRLPQDCPEQSPALVPAPLNHWNNWSERGDLTAPQTAGCSANASTVSCAYYVLTGSFYSRVGYLISL